MVGLASAVFAVVLMVYGSLVLAGTLASLPASPGLRKLNQGTAASADELEAIIAAKGGELRWQPSGRAWIEVGRAHLLRAETAGSEQGSFEAGAAKGIDALRTGLQLSPLNSRGWLLLTHALARREGWSAPARSALLLSMDTAPYEPSLLLPRLELALAAWPHLPSRDQVVVVPQIRHAWKQDPDALAAIAGRLGQVSLVRAVLLADPAAVADFDRRLATQRPESGS